MGGTVQRPVLLHALPGRCRLRVQRLRDDPGLRARLEQRLKAGIGVTGYRFNLACESVTVAYQGSPQALLDLLQTPGHGEAAGTGLPASASRGLARLGDDGAAVAGAPALPPWAALARPRGCRSGTAP